MKLPAERSIPQRHRIRTAWVGFAAARLALRASEYCGLCEKLALPSAEGARGYIALLMRSGAPGADRYDFTPYPCPHLPGMWHAGHNHKIAGMLKAAKNPEGTCHETEKENPAGRRR